MNASCGQLHFGGGPFKFTLFGLAHTGVRRDLQRSKALERILMCEFGYMNPEILSNLPESRPLPAYLTSALSKGRVLNFYCASELLTRHVTQI